MNKTKIIIAIFTISSCLFVLYNYLGGFNEPSITNTSVDNFQLIGKEYLGKSNTKPLNKMLDSVYQAYQNKELAGTFSICYFGNPDNEEDTLKVIAGTIVQSNTTASPPQGFKVIDFDAYQAVRATVNAHVFVAPNPASINKKIEEFATTHQLSLEDIFIEKYMADGQIITEVPVKQ